MKLTILALLASLLLPACCYSFQADSTKYHHMRRFTDENGLPQNSINGFAFDNAGFIWIATQGGLVRFDGQKMVTFTNERLSVDSDRFTGLKKDARTGKLYAVNEYYQLVVISNGVAVRDKTFRSEHLLDISNVLPESRTGIRVDTTKTSGNYTKYRIITGNAGRYYLYADQKVAFIHANGTKKVIPFPGEPYFDPFPSEPHLRRQIIAETKDRVCADNFMSVGGTLFYHNGGEGSRFLKFTEQGTAPLSLGGDILRDRAYLARNEHIRIVQNRFQNQAFAVLDGNIYYVTYENDANRLDTQILIEDFDIEENLIYRMLYDEANRTLLMGSFSEGLLLARAKTFNIILNTKQRDYHDVYYAHLPFSPSSVIIPDGDILGNYNTAPAEGAAFKSQVLTLRESMVRDKKGRFWIAKDKTLFRLNTNASQTEAEWQLDQKPERLYEAPDGKIWIGFRTGEVGYFQKSASAADMPVIVAKLGTECRFLYQDTRTRLWIGTSNGLYLYHTEKSAVYPVKGLAGKTIRSIFAPQPDELWITTYGHGMYLLTGNKLMKLPLDDHGYLRHAHCILQDDRGHFWISTNKGLFRTSREDLLAYARGKMREVFYLYYDKDRGFLTNEFNGGCEPCAVKLPDGTFSFPSMKGLVWFKPERLPLPDLSAPLWFENLKIDNNASGVSDTLTLRYDFSHIAFDVATPFTGLPNNLQIHYAVTEDGSKPHWAKATAQHIDLYNLKPGTYLLTARKTTGFANRAVEKRLVLIVETPWFLTWWFISLTLLCLALAFWLFTKWRLRNLTHQNAMLSRKVEERTGHLSKALEDLKISDEALQKQLQIQMRIIGVINHDLHSPLRYLNAHVPEFMEKMRPHLPDGEMAHMGSAISKSTQMVYRLADELLNFIKATYNKKGEVTYETVSVKEILDKKAQFFAELALENQTILQVECPSGLNLNTNRVMLEILLHNLLDNALKHTFDSNVTVSAAQESNGVLTLTVTDSGFGMYREIVDWLNDQPAPGDSRQPVEVPANLGLGLIMVKEIASLLGIRIIASSSEGGTRMRLEFGA